MKYSHSYTPINETLIINNININQKPLLRFINKNNIFYQFDFLANKRTINAIVNKYENKYIYETIPPFSLLLPKYIMGITVSMLMGEIKNNKLYGMKINGYKPWICGSIFKNNPNPESDINNIMRLFWNSTFPYYYFNNSEKLYIDLNQFNCVNKKDH